MKLEKNNQSVTGINLSGLKIDGQRYYFDAAGLCRRAEQVTTIPAAIETNYARQWLQKYTRKAPMDAPVVRAGYLCSAANIWADPLDFNISIGAFLQACQKMGYQIIPANDSGAAAGKGRPYLDAFIGLRLVRNTRQLSEAGFLPIGSAK